MADFCRDMIAQQKKRLVIFQSPVGMSLTKLSLRGNILIIPGQGKTRKNSSLTKNAVQEFYLRISRDVVFKHLSWKMPGRQIGPCDDIYIYSPLGNFLQELSLKAINADFPAEPVFWNVYGAQELIPRNEFRQPM